MGTHQEGRHWLQRLFSTFPGGWPGVGLVLLRAAIGGAVIVQGGAYFLDPGNLAAPMYAAGLLTIALGALLLIGFVTPVVSLTVALGVMAVALSWLPAPAQNLFEAKLTGVFAAIMSGALALLGPGAFSLDARLFGRREIIIPNHPRSSTF